MTTFTFSLLRELSFKCFLSLPVNIRFSKCTNYLHYLHTTVSLWALACGGAWMLFYFVVCVQECKFIQPDKLWQDVWCGTTNTPTSYVLVCCPYMYVCPCVNVCVQVETWASKDSLFTHSCVEQQLRDVCVRVWTSGEFPHWGPRRLQKRRTFVSMCHGRQVWLTSLPSVRGWRHF